MSTTLDWTTFGADGTIDWAAVEPVFPHAPAMKVCIQDAVFHAEGDVWTHTRMVADALFADPGFAALPSQRRTVLALAALWHDVAKPETRQVEEDGGRERITHHGHSRRGAVASWNGLWRAGVPREIRLPVFSLIMAHQRVFHTFRRDDIRAELARFSIAGSWHELILLAKADNRGRIAPNTRETEDELELVRLAAEDHGCLHGAWPFASDQARVRFARGGADSLFYDPPAPRGARMVLLCGLPGAGKDTYAARALGDLPQVSLDRLRDALDIAPEDEQGSVAQAALEETRQHLRAKRPFVFNATNITRDRRSRLIDLALAYDAEVEIHAFDPPEPVLRKRNRERKAAVPDKAIDRMISKWEPPTLAEAHRVVWVDAAKRG